MPKYLEFEVSLLGVEPRMWRGFLLANDSTFYDLHCAIQAACGWEHEHLYEFRSDPGKGARRARDWMSKSQAIAVSEHGDPYDRDGNLIPVDLEFRLAGYFPSEGKSCIYWYDFGDDWIHLVECTQLVELPETFRARLLGGERAFPLEDCGGIWGYEKSCRVARMTDEELQELEGEHADEAAEMEERREWLGDWHPEAFDLATLKKAFDH